MKCFIVDYTPNPQFHLKKPILWLKEGNTLRKIGSFNNKHSAKLFIEACADMDKHGIDYGEMGDGNDA